MHEREGEVEAPLHPAGVAAHLAVGGLGEADPLEELVARARRSSRGMPCSAAWRRRCSRPVRTGSSAASWSAAPIVRRTCGPCADDVEPADARACRRSAAAAS